MVVALPAGTMPTVGLEGDDEVAGGHAAEREGAIDYCRVLGGIAPLLAQRLGERGWQAREKRAVVVQG